MAQCVPGIMTLVAVSDAFWPMIFLSDKTPFGDSTGTQNPSEVIWKCKFVNLKGTLCVEEFFNLCIERIETSHRDQ